MAFLSIVKTLFGSWKFYAALIAAAVVALAAYSTYRWIYDGAYQEGVNATIAVYQPKIDAFNTEATVRSAKITELEATIQRQASSLIRLNAQIQDLSTSSVEAFTKEYPTTAKECAVQKQTSDAYNSFLAKALISK